jgi:hypothetical protein
MEAYRQTTAMKTGLSSKSSVIIIIIIIICHHLFIIKSVYLLSPLPPGREQKRTKPHEAQSMLINTHTHALSPEAK